MNLRSSRRNREVNPDITPLIDVVFLLLIFFIVSTTFQHNSELNITLPEAAQELTEAKLDSINIGVDKMTVVYINGKPLVNNQLQTIMDGISNAAVGLNSPPIVISADSDATHQSVIRVMDAARQLGFSRITFTTKKIEE